MKRKQGFIYLLINVNFLFLLQPSYNEMNVPPFKEWI